MTEHRQHGRHQHEHDEQAYRLIAHGLGQRQADKAEESGPAHLLDHDHHAEQEDDRRPVDTAARGLSAAAGIPEGSLHEILDSQNAPGGRRAVQTQQKDDDDHRQRG